MPNFLDKINNLKQEENEIKEDFSSEKEGQNPNNDISKNKKEEEKSSFGFSGVGFAGNEDSKEQFADDVLSEERFSSFATEGVEENKNTWSPDIVNENFLENASKNFIYGVGEMLGSLGDAFQGLEGIITDDYTGNVLSDLLQNTGEDIKNGQEIYIPEELQNPEFSLATFTNPKFWSTHGSRFLPQLFEIIGTTYLSGGIATAVKKGVTKAAKKKLIGGTARATTTGVYSGARGAVNEIANSGKGILGKILTDANKLTNSFNGIVQNSAGGLITNMRVSLSNAGEMYNTYKDLKDENGKPIFSKEQLGSMAASTFQNNMAYSLIDVMSWGMTYGKGWDVMKKMGHRSKSGILNSAGQSKYIGGMFSKSVSPLLQNIKKVGLKSVKEGTEEMFQESWEEWSKIRAYQEMNNTLKGYKGKIPKGLEADSLLDIKSFFDFFSSKENEGTRAISFGLGAMGASAFNMKTLVDKRADEAYQMYNRAENLKNIYKQGELGKSAQRRHIQNQMSELIFENKEEVFGGFMKDLIDRDVINEQEFDSYSELFNEMKEVQGRVNELDIDGKKNLINTISQIKFFEDSINIEQQRASDNIEFYKNQISDPKKLEKKIKEEEANMKKRIFPLADMLAQYNENKENILLNEKTNPVRYEIVKDKNGNERIIRIKDDAKAIENPNQPQNIKEEKTIGKKARNVLNGVLSFFKNEQNKKNQESIDNDNDIDSISDENTNIEDISNGAIDNLQDFTRSLNDGDEITINGEDGVFRGYNENSDGGIDNFDYELNSDINNPNISNTRRNARLTKNNTFFDDRTNNNLDVQRKNKKDKTVINDDNDSEITAKTMSDMTVYNKIPSGVLNKIAKKIKEKKPLSPKEKLIKKNFEKEINEINKNSRVIQDDSKTELDKEVLNNMIDNDKIPSGVLQKLASKLINGDNDFTDSEFQVLSNYNKEIEAILKERKELENKVKEDLSDSDLSDSEIDYISEASTETSLDKDSKKEKSDFEKKLKEKKYNEKIKDEDIVLGSPEDMERQFGPDKSKVKAEDILGSDDINRQFGSEGREKREAKNIIDFIKNGLKLIKKKSKFISKILPEFNLSKRKVFQGNKYFLKDSDKYDVQGQQLAEMYTVNEKLELMFPDLKPRAYAVNNLYRTLGTRGVGYSIAGSVYIDENKWDQDDIFMHEFSHVYFDLTKDDPATKSLLKHALKNKKLVDKIMNLYDDKIEYQISDKDSNKENLILNKRDILHKETGISFDLMTKEERDYHIKELEKQGKIKIVPLENQTIIAEEVFTHTLEGPLSSKYNKFFDIDSDFKRKHFAKKWWAKIKMRAKNMQNDYKYEESSFLKELNEKDFSEYNDAKSFIIDNFRNEVKGRGIDLSAEGKAKIIEDDNQKITEELFDISRRKEKQLENFNSKKEKESKNSEEEYFDKLDEELENHDPEAVFNIDRLRYLKKASKIITGFSKAYNVVLKRRFYNENKNLPTNWSKVPSFDGKLLQVKLMSIANESNSGNDFIRRIENSSVEELYQFNKFLNKTRENDKLPFLSSFWWMAKNHSNVDGVKTFIDKNGNMKVQNTLNQRELSMSENLIDGITKSSGAFYGNKFGNQNTYYDQHEVDRFTNYQIAADNIRSKVYTDEDIYNVLQFVSNGKLNIKEIMKHNRININGKSFTVRNAVKAFVISKNAMGGSSSLSKASFNEKVNHKGKVRLRKQKDSLRVYTEKGYYMPDGIRVFARSLVNANRRFTADYTITDANQNQYPVRQIDNFLTRYPKYISDRAKSMTKKDFMKEFAHKSSKHSKGNMSNKLLSMIYDNIQEGKPISIVQNHGIQNENTGDSSVIKDSNPVEQSINEYLNFLGTSRVGGRLNKTYLMELNRFSDSPRSYSMEVPLTKFEDFGTIENGKFKMKDNAAFSAVYNIYSDLGGEMSIKDFKDSLIKEISEEVSFLNENIKSLNNIKSLGNLINNNSLNNNGKLSVAEYVLNNTFNGLYFNEVFLPSVKLQNREKRAKLMTSPGFALSDNVQIEVIPFSDDLLDIKDSKGNITDQNEPTDAGMYILQEDAELLEKLAGNVMPLGKGYKGLMSGIDHTNPVFKGMNLYMKGYMTILNDEQVSQNPRLKGLHDLMKKRREKYVLENGEISKDLSNGVPTHFIFATPMSGSKAKSFPKEFYNSKELDNGKKVKEYSELGQKFSLDGLANDSTSVEQELDKWYYEDNDFVGLSGSNFVIQQRMDKESFSANTSVQMMRAILTNASVNGSLEKTENIQKLLVELMKSNSGETIDILDNGSSQDIRELLIEGMNLEEIEPLQRYLIEDGVSLNSPSMRNITRNQLGNSIRREGLKLKTPGTVAQQKPSHYEKSYGTTNGKKGLSYYTKKSDGSLNKGEAVAPKYMSKENGGPLQKRQIILLDDNGNINSDFFEPSSKTATKEQISKMDKASFLKFAEQQAKQKSRLRGVGYGEIRNKNGEVNGYYVEGDTFIATRIPAHGPQSTGVFEVVDFDTTGGSQVQLPYEFAGITTGGDFDGDQVFIQHKSKGNVGTQWNQFLDEMTKHWLSPEMANEVQMAIDFEEEVDIAISKINKTFGKNNEKNAIPFTPRQRRKAFANTLTSKANIGKTANLHGLLGLLAAYDTKLVNPITINGKTSDVISDSNAKENESRTINSAKIFNIILDNAKYGHADSLGLDDNTVSFGMILRNLGFELSDIGLIMNSPVVKTWSKLKSNQKNVFSGNNYSNDLIQDVRKQLGIKKEKNNELIIDTKNVNSNDNKTNDSILSLISYLDNINVDINKMSKIMSGHNKIEINPFLLNEQIQAFNDVTSNKTNKGIIYSEKFMNNPLVKNYKQTTEQVLENQRKMDPVYRKDGAEVYERIISGVPKNLNKKEKEILYNNIEMFFTSRLLGLNNIDKSYYQNLIKNGSKNNLFDRLDKYIHSLAKNIIKEDPSNQLNSISALDNNVLFKKAISYNFGGNNKFISLNSSFFKEDIDNELRQRIIDEFQSIPTELRNDLILYDLMSNGWKNPKSLFNVFGQNFKMAISLSSDRDLLEKNESSLNPLMKQNLIDKILEQQPELVSAVDLKNNPFSNDGKTLSNQFPKYLLDKIKKGQEVFFRYGNKIHHFRGFNKEDISELKTYKNKAVLAKAIATKAKERMRVIPIINKKNNIGLVSIKDDSTGNPYFDGSRTQTPESLTTNWYDRIIDSQKNDLNQGIEGREARRDYYNFFNKLNRSDFDKVMEFPISVTEDSKEAFYRDYLKEKSKADSIYNKSFTKDQVQKMSDTDLVSAYDNYGKKDKFAYAKLLREVVLELSRRKSENQSNITGKKYDGKDIGFMKSYFMANNIPSNHPGVQSLVRNMEVEFKKFQSEKSKYVRRINKVTNDLYKEKFGFKAVSNSAIDNIKTAYYGMFKDREKFYKKLYGNLVEVQEVLTDNGIKKNFKYRSEEEINRMYKDGIITDAEFNFFKTTTSITKDLEPHVMGNKKGRKDYIPHTSPDLFEKYYRRGLLGVLTNSKNVDEGVYDVHMNFKNPITGENEINVSFKNIQDIYNTLSAKDKKSPKFLEFYKIKKEAYKLYDKGINQDGSQIKISEIEAGSAIGDVFVDRFSKSRSTKASDFPSMDLNKAFIDYVSGALFTHGNSNFKGMKAMLPYVDGVLATAESNNDKNMANYVEKIWKDYFLSGKKQETLPTPSLLKSVNVTTDKVVDYLTKGSLLYWLGWKGLAIGGGAYAIGNILIGKYNNIKNEGTGAWVKGEKRFWLGKDGKFDIKNPFKGIKQATQILKNVGFMDINVYDDIDVQKKSSFENMFTQFALMPMVYSEKWIQGVHFLGMLSDKEWEDYSKKNAIINQSRVSELENRVKNSHGKGYQSTDQRMIQMYSWGRMMMQFSRYIPTMFYDRMSKEDINIYGKKHIGSYRRVYKEIQKMATGKMSPKDFFKYRKSLNPDDRRILDSGLVGFGFTTAMIALQSFAPTKMGNDLLNDSNALFDVEKLSRKTNPAAIAMLNKFI